MQRKTFLVVNNTDTSYLPDTSIKERPHKSVKTMINTDFSLILPDELWLLILKYIPLSSLQSSSLFFFPQYAFVNKRFYYLFLYFFNLNVSLNYSLSFIMHTLIGETIFKNYLKEEKYLRSIFLLTYNKVASISEKIDFNHLNLILEKTFYQFDPKFLGFSFIQSYENNNNFEISYVNKSIHSEFQHPDKMEHDFFLGHHFQIHTYNIQEQDLTSNITFESKMITKSEILDELFKLNTDIKNNLNLITKNSDCHAALLALAYFKSPHSNRHHFIHLAILFAEMGLLRGTIFILEMCELYNIWPHYGTYSSSQHNKNQVLKKLLYETLRYNELGEDIARYIMNRFEFQYTARFVYKVINNIYQRSLYLPIHLLALDCRHYCSAAEFLKFFQIAYQMLQDYQKENPLEFNEEQKAVLLTINFLASSSPIPDIHQNVVLIDIQKNMEFFKDELIHCLVNFKNILFSNLETLNLPTTLNQFVTAAQKRKPKQETIEKESIDDLQTFLEPLCFTQNQNDGKAMIKEIVAFINLEKLQQPSNTHLNFPNVKS